MSLINDGDDALFDHEVVKNFARMSSDVAKVEQNCSPGAPILRPVRNAMVSAGLPALKLRPKSFQNTDSPAWGSHPSTFGAPKKGVCLYR